MTSDATHRERQLATSSEPARSDEAPSAESSAEWSELQRVRLERDAALEDLAFLREQLSSTEAFYAYRLELVHACIDAEHQSLLNELSRLGSEHPRRSRRAPARDEVHAAPSEPDDVPLLPRTK